MAQKRKQGGGRPRHFAAKAPAPIVNIADARSAREALQPDRKPSVFIAVPTLTGRVNFTIALMFGRAMASSSLDDCPFHFSVHAEPGKKNIDYARNVIVKKYMERSDADWLLMMDDDSVVPENFWQLMCVKNADIVSAIVPVWIGNQDPETMLRVNCYGVDEQNRCYNLLSPPKEVAQPYTVPVLGTGAIAIRRRVFAPKPHGVGLTPFYFTHLEDRKVMGGEDINFSVEAQRAGFSLAVHPGVRFDHMKDMPLLQIEEYVQARMKMEREGRVPTEKQRLSIG